MEIMAVDKAEELEAEIEKLKELYERLEREADADLKKTDDKIKVLESRSFNANKRLDKLETHEGTHNDYHMRLISEGQLKVTKHPDAKAEAIKIARAVLNDPYCPKAWKETFGPVLKIAEGTLEGGVEP